MEKETEKDLLKVPKIGEIVQGKVIGKAKASVFFDLGPMGTGVIYGREFYDAREKMKNLSKGDSIFAKITDLENEEGYIELSLTKAGKELAWEQIAQTKDQDENMGVKIVGANKGGLLAEVMGIPAFLPVSQLSSANYPKVEGGDSQKILKALQKFIGKEMQVKVFDFDPKENKLILSEKAKDAKKVKETLSKLKEGEIVEGEITGIVDFGAFIKFQIPSADGDSEEQFLEGLIHISELDWQLIENPSEIVKVGEKVKAKIIDISNNKVSLSLKALRKDPWNNIEEKYKKGDTIKGEITKLNPFGAFVKISSQIQGLCHVSEFGSEKKMEESLEIGKKYNFQISTIEPAEHRMALKPLIKGIKSEEAKETEEKKE